MKLLQESLAIIISALVILLCWFPPPVAAQAVRGNAAPKSVLPGELRKINVKDYYIGAAARDVGVIQTVIGHAVVARGDMKQAYFAAPGDRLFEKDVVFTLKGSKCRFKLVAEDVVTMAENTRVGIKSFTDNRRTRAKSSSFTMSRGKAMFYALRLFKYKGSGMEVETPTAVSGVRGTKFGMEVIEEGGKASLPVHVADASQGFMYLAQAGGGGTRTVTHSFEGYVDVTSRADGTTRRITAGNSIEAGIGGLGTAFATPPDVSQRFQSDTQVLVPDPQGLRQGGQPGGTENATGIPARTITDPSTVTQGQSTGTVGPQPGHSSPPPASPQRLPGTYK